MKEAATGKAGFVETSKTEGIVLGVGGMKLAAGLVGSFLLGAIMPLGIGYYAPCMVLVALLGMTPTAAFPIMMGACAFLMPVASAQFVRKRKYSLRTAVGMALGGVFGSALALLVVKSLPAVLRDVARDPRHHLHRHLAASLRGDRTESDGVAGGSW